MSKASEVFESMTTGRTEEGRPYQTGVIKLNSPYFRTVTLMLLGRCHPFSEATVEGMMNSKTAEFVLSHLKEILEGAVGKMEQESLITDYKALHPDILMVFDGAEDVWHGAAVDFMMRFLPAEDWEKTETPPFYSVMFHFPRDDGNQVMYQLDEMLIGAEKA